MHNKLLRPVFAMMLVITAFILAASTQTPDGPVTRPESSLTAKLNADMHTPASAFLDVCTPPPSGIISWWSAEGNAADIFGANSGTAENGATAAGTGKVGQAFSFDGIDDRIQLGNPASLRIQNFTMEGWVKRASASVATNNPAVPFNAGTIVAYGSGGYAFLIEEGTNRLELSQVGVSAVFSTSTVTDANYHHLAVTKSGSTVTFYIDGTADTPVTYNATFTFTTNIAIGARGDSDVRNDLFGNVDELAIYNRALSGGEIGGIFTAGTADKCQVNHTLTLNATNGTVAKFPDRATQYLDASTVQLTATPSTGYHFVSWTGGITSSSNPVIVTMNGDKDITANFAVDVCTPPPTGMISWLSGEGNANDIFGANNGTLQNGATATATGKVGEAFSFDGVDDYVSIPDAPSLEPATLTLDAWVNFASLDSTVVGNGAGTQRLIHKQNARSGAQGLFASYELGKTRSGGQDKIYFCIDSNAGNEVCAIGTTIISAGQWYHVAATYDLQNLKIYVNGGVDGTTASTQPLAYAPKPVTLGRTTDAAFDGSLNGLLDEVEIFNTALTAGDIGSIYTAGTAGKCHVNHTITINATNGTVERSPDRGTQYLEASTVQLTAIPAVGYHFVNWSGDITSASNPVTVTMNADKNITANFTLNGACTPPPPGMISWYQGEGDATDLMGNHNGSPFGGISFPAGEVGQSIGFNGSSTGVDLGTWFNLQTFTIDMWVKPDPSQPSFADIIDNNHNGSRSWVVQSTNIANQWQFGAQGASVVFDLTAGTLQHLAITRDASNVSRVYVNGMLVGSATAGVPLNYDGSQFLRLGVWGGDGTRHFDGLEDEVEIFGRALNITEIQNIYNAGTAGKCIVNHLLTTTATNGTVTRSPDHANGLYLEGSTVQLTATPAVGYHFVNWTGDVTSFSNPLTLTMGSDKNITANFAPLGPVAWFTGDGDAHDQQNLSNGSLGTGTKILLGKVGQAFYMDGSPSQYITVPANPTLDAGATGTGLTVEAWMDINDLDFQRPIVEWSANSDAPGSVGTNFYFSGNSLYAQLIDTNGNSHVLQSSAFILNGGMQHVAFTYDRITGNGSIYVDNHAVGLQGFGGTVGNLGIFTPRTDRNLYIGARVSNEFGNAGLRFSGTADEIAIYNRGLTDTEIIADYNLGLKGQTKTFATPTGTNVAVRTGDQTITFPNVTTAGVTSSYSLDPAETSISGVYKPLAYNISTTAATSGNIQACFLLTAISGAVNGVRILHHEGSAWIDRTTTTNAPSNTVCSSVTSLGQFAVTVPTNPAPTGAIAWFTGDGDTRDATGLNPNGIPHGDSSYKIGKVDQSFSLDGNGDYVEIPDNANQRPANAITVEGWFKLNSTSGIVGLVSKPIHGTFTDSYQVYIQNGVLKSFIGDAAGNFEVFASSFAPATGVWYHIAFTFDDASDRANLYVNGNLIVSQATARSLSYEANPYPLLIGADIENDTLDFFLNGQADEVTLYDHALSQSEIQAIYSIDLNGKIKPAITAAGSNVTVLTGDQATTFTNVTGPGTTSSYSLDPQTFGSTAYYKFLAYNITTTAAHSGNMQVCFNLPALSANINFLHIYHYEGSSLVDRTTNTAANTVCSTVSSLGQFVVGADYILPPPTGLVSWWTGDGDARDQMGLNDGTMQAGRYTLGKVDQAFYFRNTPQNVLIPDSPSMRPQSLTVEAWVNTNNSGNLGHILAKTVGTGDLNSYVVWQEGGLIRGAIGDAGNFVQINAPLFSVKTWHHIAFTFDDPGVGTTKTLTLYVDGAVVASGTTTVAIGYDSHAALIGADYSNENINYSWQGAIDEVSLYARALPQTEIQQTYFASQHGKIKSAATPAGAGTSVRTSNEALTFSNVATPGTTSSYSLDPSGFAAISGYYRLLAYDVSTTAVFSDSVQACLKLPGASPDANSLRIFHREAGLLIDRTTSTDPPANTVCATVSSLGQFVVGQGSIKQNQIVYSRIPATADVDGTIWAVSPNGTNDHGITTGIRPRMSPDGKYLVFKRKPFGTTDLNYLYGVWIRDLNTGLETEVFRDNAHIVGADFSSDSSQVFFDHECKLFRANIDGSHLIQLVQFGDCSDDAPTVRASDGLVLFQAGGGFYTMNPDGSNVQLVPNTGGPNIDASWSINGQYFDYTQVASASAGYPYDRDSLYKIKPDGTGKLLLKTLTAPDGFGAGGAWAPNGSAIYIPAKIGGVSGIYAVATDGSGTMAFAPGANDLIAAGSNVDFIGGIGGPLAPTATDVSLSGRITTANGQGIRNVRITLVDASGTSRSVISSSLGYYRFEGVSVGEAYVISVSAKRYRFEDPSRLLIVSDDLADVDFVAMP